MIQNTSVFELIGLLTHFSLFVRSLVRICGYFTPFNVTHLNIYGFVLLIRTKRGAYELDLYLSRKHDELLASTLQPGSYKKTSSMVIVDGFTVEITEDQVI